MEVPTEVQALSSNIVEDWGWAVVDGNSIGTDCFIYDDLPALPNPSSLLPGTKHLDFKEMGVTGSIPTEYGTLTRVTYFNLENNGRRRLNSNFQMVTIRDRSGC